MSSDFAFWKAIPGEPEQIYDNVCEGSADGLSASADVLRFREELLRRLPHLKDELEPGDYELEENPENVDKYVVLTLSYGSMATGRRQLQGYIAELEEMTGHSWTGILDVYKR